jgi:Helix-turn-helix of DDE superfamily endonuclease
MTYDRIKDLKPSKFKRLTGVRPETFQAMVEQLQPVLDRRSKRGGQTKLSVQDQLLIALEYLREYRTYFHIAQSWGVHEATVCRIVHKVEQTLVRSGQFSLPGRKETQSNVELELVVVDVTEVPIERPKKSREATTVVNKNATP